MPKLKITDRALRTIDRPETGILRLSDTEVPGFIAHVQRTTTTLYFEYQNRRHLLGRFPSTTIPIAREAARELAHDLRRGLARRMVRSDPRLGELLERYLARPALRSDAWKATVRKAIESDLKWSRMKVSDITPAMVREQHARLLSRGATTANQIISSLSAVWSFGLKQDPTLPDNPTRGIEMHPEARALNKPIRDLVAWRAAVDRIENPVHRAAYHFALHTGLRRSELESLEWDRVDDAVYLPTTKSGREFWLPLVDEHQRILATVRGLHPRWVFPSVRKDTHIKGWRHAHVPGTLHSLRHTFATVGVEAGVPEEVVGRLLNHSSRTITGQIYARPKLDFLRASMQVVVEEVTARLNG